MTTDSKVVAHLDLKGVQYRRDCLDEYLDNLHQLGIGSVLVEYEDVFPFKNEAFSDTPEEVWSEETLRSFQESARQRGIEIIPLQQCLGHLEYIFRHPQYVQYCMMDVRPGVLHIGRKDAREWLKGLLCQVLEAHPDSKYIHLGMDEAVTLTQYAAATKQDVLELFLDYLAELCAVCERYGKTPLIWGDMLEDHVCAANIDKISALRDKVIVVPWSYYEAGKPQQIVRFAGLRCSRRWLETPEAAPDKNWNPIEISDRLQFFEDWPAEIQQWIAEYKIDEWSMAPFFQARLWKKLGFRVWGAAGAGITHDRSVLPFYNRRIDNVRAWLDVVDPQGVERVILTHWARSNTFSTPNAIADMYWPILAAVHPQGLEVFYRGIAPEQLQRIVFLLGKCREDWSVEASLIEAMSALADQLSQHRYEWQTLILMLRIWQVQRRMNEAYELADCYAGIHRLPEQTWADQRGKLHQLQRQLDELQVEARAHLQERYYGKALEEWVQKVFVNTKAQNVYYEMKMQSTQR